MFALQHTNLWDSQAVKLPRDKQIHRKVESYSVCSRKSNWTEIVGNKGQLSDRKSDWLVCDWIDVLWAHNNETKERTNPTQKIFWEVISVDWLQELFTLIDGRKTEAEMKLNELYSNLNPWNELSCGYPIQITRTSVDEAWGWLTQGSFFGS